MSKEITESKLRSMKHVLEYDGEWPKRAVELLELGRELKDQIGDKGDESKGKDGSGLLGRLSAIEDELRLIVTEHNLEGVRFNNTVFRVTAQSGKSSVNVEDFKKELLMRDVDLKVIREAETAATKVGSAFWKREWKEVK